MTDINALYSMMPPSGRPSFWQIIVEWYSSLSDPKSASEAFQFFLKIVPLAGVVILPVIFFILSYFFDSIKTNFQQYPLLFWIVIAAIGVFLSFYLITVWSDVRQNRMLNRLDVHRDLKIKQYVSHAHIIDHLNSVHLFRFIVRARKDGVVSFPVIFNWSGEGILEVKCRNKKFTVSKQKRVIGGFTRVDITLDKALNRNDEIEIEYHIVSCAHEETPPIPHLGLNVFCTKFPKLNTHLMVSFDTQCQPISIYREFFISSYSLGAYKTLTVSLDKEGKHRWSVRGLRNWLYCIRWDFEV